MIKCDICDSPLMMDADKSGATCTKCGMKYTIEQVREMIDPKPIHEPIIDYTEKTEEKPIEVSEWKECEGREESSQEEPVEVTEWEEKPRVNPVNVQDNDNRISKKKLKLPVYLYVMAVVGILLASRGGFFPMLIGDIIVIVTIALFVIEVRKNK